MSACSNGAEAKSKHRLMQAEESNNVYGIVQCMLSAAIMLLFVLRFGICVFFLRHRG